MRGLLVHYVRSKRGDTTIGALLTDPIIGPFVPTLTLADLGVETPTLHTSARTGLGSATASMKRGRNGAAQTRTAEGRDAYDE